MRRVHPAVALPVVVLTLLVSTGARAADAAAVSPYLFFDASGAMHLSWRSGLPQDDGAVQLFEGEQPLPSLKAELIGDLFRARLPSSCDDGSALSYRVAGMKKPVTIRRPPCAGKAGEVRFSFVTDTQQDAALSGRFARRVASRGADFVLHGGDVVQVGGSEEQWSDILNELSSFAGSVPLVTAAGNHEYIFDSEGELLAKYLGLKDERSWYRFSSGPVDVFVLNSCYAFDRDRRTAQVVWLRGELERSTRERPEAWRLVLFHHPPYSLGVGHSPWFWKREYEVMRRYYVPAFEELGVDLVLSGHTHLYERSLKEGVHYVVGGAAGGIMGWFGGENPYSQLSKQVRTVSHIEANPRRLKLVTESLDGAVVDRLLLERPAALRVANEGEGATAIPDRRLTR